MSKYNRKKILPRYRGIIILMTLLGIAVMVKALYIMTAKREFWNKVLTQMGTDKQDTIWPTRGDILSDDGQLMASSMPRYKVYMDFQTGGKEKDSLLMVKLDSICEGLHTIFPEIEEEYFRQHILEGRKKGSRHWLLVPQRIDHNAYKRVEALPVFNLSPYKGGFHNESFLNSRERPFGSLAKRVIGDLHGEMDSPRFGLEMSFDSVLRGTPGLRHIKRVSRTNLSVVDENPVNGDDIVTTINMRMQDIAEAAVVKELKLINGETGVAIVMEVETGDIKAMVNMERMANGEYGEIMSHAISDLLEPGSVFKTASLMVALDDGKVDTTAMVDTGNGIYHMHTRDMKDHNWRKGGYGRISVPRILQVSSNIGVSRIIDENYGKNPEQFVDGIYRLGLADDLRLPLPGYAKPIIRKPKRSSNGKLVDWPLTKLPWMSIGYETQIPPISMVTFYNAIANNGRMMRPRIVKAVMRDGKVIREYPTEVMREQICKPTTLSKIRTMLEQVVSIGLGKQAGSQSFMVAGKTGTAQVSKGRMGYTAGTVDYLLSFAGYFPAEKPKYTCIVCIRKSGLPASGGGMSGVVFHDIAEGIMAHYLKVDASQACDTTETLSPRVKKGDLKAADFVLTNLGYRSSAPAPTSMADGTDSWGTISFKENIFMFNTNKASKDIMPDVTGAGARDAVYQLEKLGLRTRLEGRGKVAAQSIPAGNKIHRGQTCVLTLK